MLIQCNSFRQLGSLAFSSPLSAVNHAYEPSSTLICALPPAPKDCRQKRKPHGALSTRSFSIKKLESSLEEQGAPAELETPDVQKHSQSQQDLRTNRAQLHRDATGAGGMKSATHQGVPFMRLPRTSEYDQSAVTRLNDAITSDASSENDRATNAPGCSLQDTCSASLTAEALSDSVTGSKSKLSPPGESVMNNANDANFVSCAVDESTYQLDKDIPEGDECNEKDSETHAPLKFQIPEDILRAAMTAPENTKASFWSSSLYRGSEGKRIAIHYCKTREVAERVAQHFVKEKVVGFDIEWKPWAAASSIKKNVSLIQLASEDRIALFHIALFAGTTAAQLLPRTLKVILESPDVYKVGVAVKGDFSRITKFLEVEPRGVFELSRLYNLVEWYATDSSKVTNKLVSLASQVQRHLQLPLYKGGHLIDDPEDLLNVRSSDWSLPLNVQQIHYAAADAYAGFRLYDVLEEKRKQLKPTPPRPLVCDYDSKPVPRYSKSKKKRKTANKGDSTTNVVMEEVVARVKREQRIEEEVGEETELTQESEGYETAQEQLTDSHQLEVEEQEFSQESLEGISDGDNDFTIGSVPSAKDQSEAIRTDAGQSPKRVGRINKSSLKGYDPGYPILPSVHRGDGPYTSQNKDLAESSVFEKGNLSSSNNLIEEPNEDTDSSSDEFEDSELEEVLRDLDIDNDGRIQENTNRVTSPEPVTTSNQAAKVSGSSLGARYTQLVGKPHIEALHSPEDHRNIHNIGYPNASQMQPLTNKPAASAAGASSGERRHFIDLPNEPEFTSYLNASSRPTMSPPPSSLIDVSTESVGPSNRTPEYDFATSWARTYLASTIPSPTLRTLSHIRATIPHLRAYNMWYHQELSLSEIARHLRDPPLSESTVGSYVLQAITLEKMECDANEVRKVLMDMPEALRKGKWRDMAEKVGAK